MHLSPFGVYLCSMQERDDECETVQRVHLIRDNALLRVRYSTVGKHQGSLVVRSIN